MNREILERCRKAHGHMKELESQIDNLTLLQAQRVRRTYSRSPDRADTVFQYVSKREELELEHAKALIVYASLFLEISEASRQLPELQEESILAYCDEESSAKLAQRLGRSADYMRKIRRKALSSFEKI